MRFCARKDGVFRLILNVAHTCTMFNLTTPAAFIKDLSETTSRKPGCHDGGIAQDCLGDDKR